MLGSTRSFKSKSVPGTLEFEDLDRIGVFKSLAEPNFFGESESSSAMSTSSQVLRIIVLTKAAHSHLPELCLNLSAQLGIRQHIADRAQTIFNSVSSFVLSGAIVTYRIASLRTEPWSAVTSVVSG